jgi:DNA primase
MTRATWQRPAPASNGGLAAWYHRIVKQAAYQRLDQAFPELGLIPSAAGWRATDEAAATRSLSVAASEISCSAPGAFLVQGRRVDWLDHLNGGEPARGAAFARCVRELARRSSTPEPAIATPPPALTEAVSAVREAWFEHAHTLATSQPGGRALHAHLARRGIGAESLIEQRLIGLAPGHMSAHNRLRHKGFGDALIEQAGVLGDGRWPGRMVGAWRDAEGRIATFFADSTDGQRPLRLWLAGAARPPLPYLACDLSSQPGHVLLVEDPLAALAARAAGERRVLASGPHASAQLFAGMARAGVTTVTLLAPGEALLEAALAALALGLEVGVADFPAGPTGELTLLLARTASAIVEVSQARSDPLTERLLADRLALADEGSAADRALALLRCAPILQAIAGQRSAQLVAQRVADACRVDADCLARILERSADGQLSSEDALCETQFSDARALLAKALGALSSQPTADIQARAVADEIRAALAPGASL